MSSTSTTSTAKGPRTTTLLLTTALLLFTLLPAPSASMSVLSTLKHHASRRYIKCPNDEVSAVCFQCASMDPTNFWDIHNPCCEREGQIRRLCRAWYFEEPKRGRRDVWYY